MTDESLAKLHTLLRGFADRNAGAPPAPRPGQGEAERKRRACAECLRSIVRPVLEVFRNELKDAGHEASTRDQTDREDALPSVALSFTPRIGTGNSHGSALASALIFKYDPRRGVLVQRDVKVSPAKGRIVSASGDRTGTMAVDGVTPQWVETKTLTFVEDVLKAN